MEEEMARTNAENFDMEAEQDGDLDALDTEEVFGEQVYETPEMIEAGEIADFVELDQLSGKIQIDTENESVLNYMLVLSPFDLK